MDLTTRLPDPCARPAVRPPAVFSQQKTTSEHIIMRIYYKMLYLFVCLRKPLLFIMIKVMIKVMIMIKAMIEVMIMIRRVRAWDLARP